MMSCDWRLLFRANEYIHGKNKSTSLTSHDERRDGKRIVQRERQSNYLKGVKWSPDGTCLLTSSLDKIIRLFILFASIILFLVYNSSNSLIPFFCL